MPKLKNVETHVPITPAGLESLCTEIWGAAWRAKFSEALGISYSQLHRYMTVYNGQRIPQVVVVALEGLRMLKTGPEGAPLLSIAAYRRPVAEALPVKFVQEKKPRPERSIDTTPLADFFTEEPEAPAPPAPEPEPEAPAPSLAKASAKLGKALSPKTPAKSKAGTGTGSRKGTGTAKPETEPAKKPAAKAKADAPAKRPAPRRADLAKTA